MGEKHGRSSMNTMENDTRPSQHDKGCTVEAHIIMSACFITDNRVHLIGNYYCYHIYVSELLSTDNTYLLLKVIMFETVFGI